MIGSNRITLVEYGPYVPLCLSKIDFAALQHLNSFWQSALRLKRPPFNVKSFPDGRLEIRAENVTGIVRVGSFDFEIVPKFLRAEDPAWREALRNILTYSKNGIDDDRLVCSNVSKDPSLIDVIADIFIESYIRGLVAGFPRKYKTGRSEGVVLKGSLDYSRIQQMTIAPWCYPYQYDYIDRDDVLAGLLGWAANHLSMNVESEERSNQLRGIAKGLSYRLGFRPRLIDARRASIPSYAYALLPAFKISLLLLEGSGESYLDGRNSISGYLWKSDAVFEDFVYYICTRAGDLLHLGVSKESYSFGTPVDIGQKTFSTIPDIVFKNSSNKVVAIADAKYKLFSDAPSTSDVYQIVFDARLLGTRKAALIYPDDSDLLEMQWGIDSALDSQPVYLSAVPLNLIEVRNRSDIDRLVEKMTSWLSS